MQGLPWQMQAAFFMAGGLCVAVPLLLIPKSTLARWSQLEFTRWQLRLLSPNFITLYGLVLTLFGAAVFFLARKILPHAEFWGPFCGLLIAVKGRVLDILDGKTSKAEQEAGLPRSKFDRWVGSWFDPGATKGATFRSSSCLRLIVW